MSNLRITEIKAFVPSKNFEISKQFYQDLGFTMDSDDDGIAYFHFENVSFLLQDYCVEALAENFMMHILVEDVDAWWGQVLNSGVVEKYGVRITPIELCRLKRHLQTIRSRQHGPHAESNLEQRFCLAARKASVNPIQGHKLYSKVLTI